MHVSCYGTKITLVTTYDQKCSIQQLYCLITLRDSLVKLIIKPLCALVHANVSYSFGVRGEPEY